VIVRTYNLIKMSKSDNIDYNRNDLATLSNYGDVLTEHLHFEWSIDFLSKQLIGSVSLRMRMNRAGVAVIDLDSSKQEIFGVTIDGSSCNYKIASSFKALGNKLR
jgi:leukotriene-A4 hydrolase